MSQRVPSWCGSSDHEVAELTWENGQLALHGLGPPRLPHKPLPSAWGKPRAAGGTLESIVDQATSAFPPGGPRDAAVIPAGSDVLVPWLNHHRRAAEGAALEALVPCSADPLAADTGSAPASIGDASGPEEKGAAVARDQRVGAGELNLTAQSVTGSAATFGTDRSRQVTVDTCETELGAGFTSTSLASPGNTNTSAKTAAAADADRDSLSHGKPQGANGKGEEKRSKGKSSVSTKRSCAAAVHNQSERKRRERINQRMKTLQKLVPNSSKTDKASMLDEVIEYLKNLQAQAQMISRLNMSPMMLPMPIQGQLQLPLMASMGLNMGMVMGMSMGINVMDVNAMGCPNVSGIPPVLHPAALMPQTSRDGICSDRAPTAVMLDPMSPFFSCPPQPMTLDAYSRMAALYQQLHQPPASGSKG